MRKNEKDFASRKVRLTRHVSTHRDVNRVDISSPDIPSSIDPSMLRVGYNVYRMSRDHGSYKTVKRWEGKTQTAVEEIVCVAMPTDTPHEYLLKIAGRSDLILLPLDHGYRLNSADRPKRNRRIVKASPGSEPA